MKGLKKMITLFNKKKSDYTIVLPRNHSLSQQTASEELQKYFKIMGDVELKIIKDDIAATEKEIVLGQTNRDFKISSQEISELGDEGLIIKTVDEKLFIFGSDIRGTLYGVYTFLEKYCGCGFYADNCEKVPELEKLEINQINNKEIPVFEFRNSNWKSVFPEDISAKLKINAGPIRELTSRVGGNMSFTGQFEHTLGYLSGRCKEGEADWSQPCLSDPDIFNNVVDSVRKMLKNNPDAKIISISQNDGAGNYCRCPKCTAIADREEAYMGIMLDFVNRIADVFKEEYPNVKFDTLSYRFTRKPPKYMKPRENVLIRLCDIENCFRHPISECSIYPAHHDIKDVFMDDLKAWAKITDNLYIWTYTTNFTNYSTLYPNYEVLLKNARTYAENGIKGVFEQGNSESYNGEFGELKGYILAKILWDPYMSEEQYWKHIDEFLLGYYGKGGKYIGEYIKMALECSKDSHFGIYFDDSSKYIYVRDMENPLEGAKEFLRRGELLWAKAEEEAETEAELSALGRSKIQLLNYKNFVLHKMLDVALENEKAKLNEEIIMNNKKHLEYMQKYDVTYNQEHNCIIGLKESDFSGYPLLWKVE